MSEQKQLNLVHRTLAKGATAQLREIAETCQDRETARVIYTELRRIALKLAYQYDFPMAQEAEIIKQRRAA